MHKTFKGELKKITALLLSATMIIGADNSMGLVNAYAYDDQIEDKIVEYYTEQLMGETIQSDDAYEVEETTQPEETQKVEEIAQPEETQTVEETQTEEETTRHEETTRDKETQVVEEAAQSEEAQVVEKASQLGEAQASEEIVGDADKVTFYNNKFGAIVSCFDDTVVKYSSDANVPSGGYLRWDFDPGCSATSSVGNFSKIEEIELDYYYCDLNENPYHSSADFDGDGKYESMMNYDFFKSVKDWRDLEKFNNIAFLRMANFNANNLSGGIEQIAFPASLRVLELEKLYRKQSVSGSNK